MPQQTASHRFLIHRRTRALAVAGVVLQLAITLLASLSVASAQPVEQDLFISGSGGYNTYRIPSVVVTNKGALLAFCEGRKDGRSDAGDIDLLLSRSTDGGKTWSKPQVVWTDDANTCGNPCAVLDRATGTIWLLLTWNSGKVPESRIQAGFGADSRRVFVTSSDNEGQTWAQPREITPQVKKKSWTWYATGPGCGIQIKHGKYRSRLVIPCDHKVRDEQGEHYDSHVIYSDDHGKTWRLGGNSPKDKVNECEVVELSNPAGRLLLNMRNYDRAQHARQRAISDDGGLTWKDQRFDEVLIEPICQASIRRVRWPQAAEPGVILFSNPASPNSRKNMTIRASFDDGTTWPVAKRLYAGSSAYSCLCVLANGDIGCLYEKDGYKRITFARFPLSWLTDHSK